MRSDKAEAKAFLQGLERYLNLRQPAPSALVHDIEAVVSGARASKDKRQRANAIPEAAVINRYIAPHLARYLAERFQLDTPAAREAFLAESHGFLSELATTTPARSIRHPFSKVIGSTPREIVSRWKTGKGLTQSCPDLAIRAPAPFSVVFEAKYFRTGGVQRAESELATGIYQAFFYRGLPLIPQKGKRPAWDYEYACLMVCDCSPKGSVVKAWRSLPPAVRTACWDGANIYVMVLRGKDGQPVASA